MEAKAQAPHFEPRWPVALAILSVICLLALLPGRFRVLPQWAGTLVGFAVLAPVVAVWMTGAEARWLRIERTVTLVFFAVVGGMTLFNLASLIYLMLNRSMEVSGLQLLASSIAAWVTNILIYSLLYWQLDRGGPESRLARTGPRPDWLFPQEGAPAEDVPPGWAPVYVDYLFLSYSTATAFSTTDVMPLTSRAKMLMMLESLISLVTIVAVAARAINILGG
jgi:hypothetical protein